MNDVIQIKESNQIKIISDIKDNYSYQVNTWVNWMIETGEGINEEGIKKYFSWLNNESGYKARTISIKRQAVKKRVRQLYRTANVDERIKIDRVLHDLDHEYDTKAPKVNTSEITPDRVLDNADFLKLINACRSDRQQMFISFLNMTGARVSEMINIKLSDCEILDNTVKIRITGKGSKERFLRITLQMYNHIKDTFKGNTYLMETGRGRSYNRCYVSTQITKIGKRINRKISAHSLRHSFATRKVQQLPGKIDAVSRYLGHKNISTTLSLYCHSYMSDDELFQEVI